MATAPQHVPLATMNHDVSAWVEEVARLTQPQKIYWCDGSDAEFETIKRELVADKQKHQNFEPAARIGGRFTKLIEENGVIGRTVPGDILCFSPPLIITEAEVDEMLDRVGRALDELTVQLRREQIAVVR